MMFFRSQPKGFFSAAADYFLQILFPGKNDCPVNEASLASVRSIYKTRFTPPGILKPTFSANRNELFRSSFTPPVASAVRDASIFETSFTPTPCPRGKTFVTGFYPEATEMPYRRGNPKSCTKKEYEPDYKPYFSALSPSDGAFNAPAFVQSLKNWVSNSAN